MAVSSYQFLFGIIAVFLLMISVRDVAAEKCYVCVGCNDPFDKDQSLITTVDCEGSCMKSKVGDVVARSCNMNKMDNSCSKTNNIEVCHCDGNLCNTAPPTTMSMLTLGAAFAVFLIHRIL